MLDSTQAFNEAQILNRRHIAENYRNALKTFRPIRIAAAGLVLGAGLLSAFLAILMRF